MGRASKPEARLRLLGVLGGMSWTSTEIYYRLLNAGVAARLGGLHSARLLVHSVDFEPIAVRQHAGDWAGTAEILGEAARGLAAAGAEGVLLATNTMHKVADDVRSAGLDRVGFLGTAYTMEDSFLLDRLAGGGVETVVPPAPARAEVHRIIFDELVRDVVREDSRATYRGIMADLVAAGARGMILGCTEIGLLIGPDDTTVPVFDTTEIHADAAVDWMVSPSR
jgi:aspartate racemase